MKIAVIGGGASGMMAAIAAARHGGNVTIYEAKERLGKKILATGNGKCNYTNLMQADSCYRGAHPEFSKEIRAQFDEQKTIQFFEQIGIFPKVKNGYVYPNSEQAASVADALVMEVRALHIKILQEEVQQVEKLKNQFAVYGKETKETYDRVILCMGSCAGMKDTAKFTGYRIAEALGHRIEKVMPALVQLRCREKWFKTLAGVRCEGVLSVYADDKKIVTEKGELLFAEYGLSGIPTFQVSRYAGRELDRGRKVHCSIDFFDSMNVEQLERHLEMRLFNSKYRSAEEMLIGLMNHKLNYVILKECGINPTEPAQKEFNSTKVVERVARKYKDFSCQVTALNPFSNAQVCAGGIDTTEINQQTTESKLHKGLYFAGELVDVDGTCGGYNLQWAWSSGYVAGLHAATEKE